MALRNEVENGLEKLFSSVEKRYRTYGDDVGGLLMSQFAGLTKK